MRALTIGVAAVVVFATLALIYIARWEATDRERAITGVGRQSTNVRLYADLRAGALTETTYAAAYFILRQPVSRDRVLSAAAQVDAGFGQLAANTPASDANGLQHIQSLREAHAGVARDYQRVFTFVDQGDMAGVLRVSTTDGIAQRAEQLTLDLGTSVDDSTARLSDAQHDLSRAEDASNRLVIAIVVVGALVLMFTAGTILLWIVRPLERVRRATRDIAVGAAQTRAPVEGPSEIADLATDVNTMAQTLLARTSELERTNTLLESTLAAEREHSRRDPLTNALNHGAIESELRALMADARGAVVMVDVDGMKAVNDTFGHLVGDELLRTVAAALESDSAIVGRYGGDEFVTVLPGADHDEAERYRAAVERRLASADLRDPETGSRVAVVASLGVATFPTEALRIDDLINLADSAMYAAKRQRPAGAAASGRTRLVVGDRAARIVSDLVPLLAHGGSLDEKLRLVAHHLSVGAGYEAVTFDVFDVGAADMRDENVTIGTNAFVDASEDIIDQWRHEQRTVVHHPVGDLLERTRRPVIMDDLARDERLTDGQRQVLNAAGIRSGISVPLLWQDEVIGTMSVGSKSLGAFDAHDGQFLIEVATHVSAIIRMERLVAHLQTATARLAGARDDTVVLLAASVEAHDQTTGRHLQGVRSLTEALALEMGYAAIEAERLGIAAVLHDVGKIRVPDAILTDPDHLTEDQWLVMKQHTVWGAEFLSARPGFELASKIARAHHERWDGSGYPRGLIGSEIPEEASIVAVADAFDAITNDRPYRKSRPVAAAVREIARASATQFNPTVVAALLRLYRRREIVIDYRALDERTQAA